MNFKTKLPMMLLGSISITAFAFPAVSLPPFSAPAPVTLSSPVSVPIQISLPPLLPIPNNIDPPAAIQLPVPDFSKFESDMKKLTEERDRRFNPPMVIPATPSDEPSLQYQPQEIDLATSDLILKPIKTAPANMFNPNYRVDTEQIEKQQCTQLFH